MTCLILGYFLLPWTHHTGPDPKSHAKENLRRIRQIQAKAKLKQEEASKPVKPVYKPTKYEQIQPKVTVHMQVS